MLIKYCKNAFTKIRLRNICSSSCSITTHFLVSAQYATTTGYCRYGAKWPNNSLWDCSPGHMTDAECAKACDANAECAAYDRKPISAATECCLFKKGNIGDGRSGRVCMVKKVTNYGKQ